MGVNEIIKEFKRQIAELYGDRLKKAVYVSYAPTIFVML
jgi:hypothetical protein